jgi:hypothetical protein
MRKSLKLSALTLILVLAFSPFAHAADQDTWLDKLGDWYASRGKPPAEQKRIQLERQTRRLFRRYSAGMENAALQAPPAADKQTKRLQIGGEIPKKTGPPKERYVD